MKLNLEWNSEEVHGDYPALMNAPKIMYQWTATEELIIERTHQKMVENVSSEKLSPRERLWRGFYSKDSIDYVPLTIPFTPNAGNRTFDAFAEPPSIIHNRDLFDHPNLNLLSAALFYSRIPSDVMMIAGYTFGEEVVTRKFRLVEHGPPLAVEGIAQTKDLDEAKANMEWFLDNVPDPAHRGLFQVQLWTAKQTMKYFPEFMTTSSCCAGSLATATFLRGPKEFLIDVRKRPELADLAIKCGTEFLLRKIDRTIEMVGKPFDIDNKDGNRIFWCDGGGGYLTPEEFSRTYGLHFGASIPHISKKGFPPYIATVAGKASTKLVAQSIQENIGGGIMVGTGVPPVDESFELFDERDKTLDNIYYEGTVGSKVVLSGTEEMRKWLTDFVGLCAKTPEKGLRWSLFSATLDPHTELPSIDMLHKLHRELLKYPVTG
jgi:hypothetical protein